MASSPPQTYQQNVVKQAIQIWSKVLLKQNRLDLHEICLRMERIKFVFLNVAVLVSSNLYMLYHSFAGKLIQI